MSCLANVLVPMFSIMLSYLLNLETVLAEIIWQSERNKGFEINWVGAGFTKDCYIAVDVLGFTHY